MDKNNGITILLHQRDVYPDTGHHLIWRLVRLWREMGIGVTVVKGAADALNDDHLLLPHIDLTLVPPEYKRVIQSAPRALNRNMNDISKRFISRNLVSATDGFEGPVIVKTNDNCGGNPEYDRADIGGKILARVQPLFGRSRMHRIAPGKYPVYPSVQDVPNLVWNDSNLVVEKFIPEREGDYYCNRVCFFLGDVVLNRRVYSKSKVIKGDVIEYSEPAEVPQAIHRFREETGFEYGKLDYVMHEGIVHILDTNKTPGEVADGAINESIAGKLARGIECYL
jgi:hypothetical protein